MLKRSKFQIRSDAAKQRWVRDDKKEAFWRSKVEEWKSSGLSKRAFCEQSNLSDSSFNAWAREISIRDREKVTSANAMALLAEERKETPGQFVPLRILPSEPRAEKNVSIEKSNIELQLPGGCILRLTRESDFSLVKQLFDSLEAK